jgi:hypothetical protein
MNATHISKKGGDVEAAKLYIRVNGAIYRFKVFEGAVWIERQQPHASNIGILKENQSAADVYQRDSDTWNLDAMKTLIELYEEQLESDQ